MPTLPPTLRPVGQRSPREVDRDRGSARERGYTTAWDKASKARLAAHPLCLYCEHGAFGAPRASAATLTDHFYPQRRFSGVFWRSEWWVSCCADCHAAKQSLERGPRSALDALAVRLRLPVLGAAP